MPLFWNNRLLVRYEYPTNYNSEVAFAKLYTTKTPITKADLLNDKVLPFFDEQGIGVLRIHRSHLEKNVNWFLAKIIARDVDSIHILILVLYNTNMSIKKVFFGSTKIQKLNRVVLDQNLLSTLNLNIGDIVVIELDVEHETIMISRATESPKDKLCSSVRGKYGQK